MSARTPFTWNSTAGFAAAALLALLALPAAAANVQVDAADTTSDAGGCGTKSNPCNTIQNGVDNASPGDTLNLKGLFEETVYADVTGLTIQGRGKGTRLRHDSPLVCRDPSRTDFVGGPGSMACRTYDGDQASCEDAWALSDDVGAVVCFYDFNNDTCEGCGWGNLRDEDCFDTCGGGHTLTIDAADVTVKGLTLVDSPAHAIAIAPGVAGTELTQVSVLGAAASCVYDFGTGTTMKRNTLKGCGDNCVYSSGLDFSGINNDVSHCGDNGYNVKGMNGLVSNNELYIIEGEAIEMSGFGHEASNNVIMTIEDEGIRVRGSDFLVKGNTGDGFYDEAVEADCFDTCVDPTRTTYAPGPNTMACRQFSGNQAACEAAWSNNSEESVSCFYDGGTGDCRGCAQNNARNGLCTNTCQQQTCDDPTRTDFVGGPGTSACRVYDGDQASCLLAWAIAGNGGATSCRYDDVNNECRGCPPNRDGCVNTCQVNRTCGSGLIAKNSFSNTVDDECFDLFAQGSGLVVENNTCRYAAEEGYTLNGSGIRLENNKVFSSGHECDESGYEVSGTGHTLEGNLVVGQHGDGFKVDDDAANITLINNTAKDGLDDGFDVHGGAVGTTLTGNLANGNLKHGFEVSENADNTDLSGNVAKNSGIAGYCDEGDNTTASGDKFDSTSVLCSKDRCDGE